MFNLRLRDLDIPASGRKSLKRTLDAEQYYTDIYNECIRRVIYATQLPPASITLVDYGGGHGLLGITAKRIGIGRVIYVDINADAVDTMRSVAAKMGVGPDVVLQGDARTLRQWCDENGVVPQALIAIDVIEHIYVLDEFFAQVYAVNPAIAMVFTTASTPYNKRVVRRLHKAMQRDEKGTARKKGFLQMRREHIMELHPDMSEREAEFWAENTRGLDFEDVARAVDSRSPNLLLDPYNTCDPRSGSWTERILPIDDYRQLLMPYGFALHVLPGRYNQYRHGPKAWISRHYNKRIDKAPDHDPRTFRERRSMRRALKVAPYIYLIVDAERESEK